MKFYSTNKKCEPVSFKEAFLTGLAFDDGLFMPEVIPELSSSEIESMGEMSYPQIAATILSKFIDLEYDKLLQFAKEAYTFDVPLENLTLFSFDDNLKYNLPFWPEDQLQKFHHLFS